MSRKREAIFLGIGILTGLALSGPAAQAVAGLTATPGIQAIYVDGRQVAIPVSAAPRFAASTSCSTALSRER